MNCQIIKSSCRWTNISTLNPSILSYFQQFKISRYSISPKNNFSEKRNPLTTKSSLYERDSTTLSYDENVAKDQKKIPLLSRYDNYLADFWGNPVHLRANHSLANYSRMFDHLQSQKEIQEFSVFSKLSLHQIAVDELIRMDWVKTELFMRYLLLCDSSTSLRTLMNTYERVRSCENFMPSLEIFEKLFLAITQCRVDSKYDLKQAIETVLSHASPLSSSISSTAFLKSLFLACCKFGDIDVVKNQNLRLNVDKDTFLLLALKNYCHFGHLEEAIKIFQQLNHSDEKTTSNVLYLKSMIAYMSYLSRNGDFKNCSSVFDEVERIDIRDPQKLQNFRHQFAVIYISSLSRYLDVKKRDKYSQPLDCKTPSLDVSLVENCVKRAITVVGQPFSEDFSSALLTLLSVLRKLNLSSDYLDSTYTLALSSSSSSNTSLFNSELLFLLASSSKNDFSVIWKRYKRFSGKPNVNTLTLLLQSGQQHLERSTVLKRLSMLEEEMIKHDLVYDTKLATIVLRMLAHARCYHEMIGFFLHIEKKILLDDKIFQVLFFAFSVSSKVQLNRFIDDLYVIWELYLLEPTLLATSDTIAYYTRCLKRQGVPWQIPNCISSAMNTLKITETDAMKLQNLSSERS